MLFKRKDDHLKDIEAKYKDIETKSNAEISEIEKLTGAGERLKRYQALGRTLRDFTNGNKPGRVTGRKETRTQYGSVSNARALYKLEQSVNEKAEKEAEAIRSLAHTAQLRQQFKADFSRELPAKDTTRDILKEAKAEIREDIKEIKKIDDPAERLARYEALDKTIDGFYDGIKPVATHHDYAKGGAILGTLGGLGTAAIVGGIVAPLATGPVIIAFVGGGVISGATGGAGLAGLLGGKEERKKLRAKYGSIRNARAMYRLDKSVEKKAKKAAEPLRARARAEKLQQQVDEAFNKKAPPAPVETAPVPAVEAASTPLKLRLRTEVSPKQ